MTNKPNQTNKQTSNKQYIFVICTSAARDREKLRKRFSSVWGSTVSGLLLIEADAEMKWLFEYQFGFPVELHIQQMEKMTAALVHIFLIFQFHIKKTSTSYKKWIDTRGN